MARAQYCILASNESSSRIVRTFQEEHIRYCLRGLLLTQKGERLLYPKIGSDIAKLLFRPLHSDLQTELKSKVESAVREGEPRVKLLETHLCHDKTDKSKLLIALRYEILDLQKVDQLEVAIAP